MESLWLCPICKLDTKTPRVNCPNCGANLLLFAKIKLKAQDLVHEGKEDAAKALYCPKKSEP